MVGVIISNGFGGEEVLDDLSAGIDFTTKGPVSKTEVAISLWDNIAIHAGLFILFE